MTNQERFAKIEKDQALATLMTQNFETGYMVKETQDVIDALEAGIAEQKAILKAEGIFVI